MAEEKKDTKINEKSTNLEQNVTDKKDEIFKLKPVVVKEKKDGSIEVKENKRKTVSPYNRLKHGKYASLPAECNHCYYRPEDEGGNGRCPVYEKDSVCVVREDIAKFTKQFSTRDPEKIKDSLDDLGQMLLEQVFFAGAQAGWDGNLIDKATGAQINQFLHLVKTSSELGRKITFSATQEETTDKDRDMITKMFKQVKWEDKAE